MTRFEQIAAAFPLHAQRIAEETFAQTDSDWFDFWLNGPHSSHIRASSVLHSSFNFSTTIEGFEYWYALADGART
jgi:hypothetical protein